MTTNDAAERLAGRLTRLGASAEVERLLDAALAAAYERGYDDGYDMGRQVEIDNNAEVERG